MLGFLNEGIRRKAILSGCSSSPALNEVAVACKRLREEGRRGGGERKGIRWEDREREKGDKEEGGKSEISR